MKAGIFLLMRRAVNFNEVEKQMLILSLESFVMICFIMYIYLQ